MTGRILVVDDVIQNVRLLEAKLATEYYTVLPTYSGIECLEKVKEFQPDIILLDVMMPEMDGFEATTAIRKYEKKLKRKEVPIIALTADAMIGDREKCLSYGMNDYINKPFKETDIANALGEWIKK